MTKSIFREMNTFFWKLKPVTSGYIQWTIPSILYNMKKNPLAPKGLIRELSGRVLDSRLGPRVRVSPASLCCVLEQDTVILALSTGSTQEDLSRHS